MAVSAEPELMDQSSPPPPIRIFVRLKLRIMANAMRGSTRRAVGFAIGLVLGAFASFGGFAGFVAAAAVPSDPGSRFVLVTALGAAVTAGWLLLPLLFFGVDETLDPARFALLPVPPAVLVRGMLAAACVGIPPIMTLAACSGLILGSAFQGGAAAAVVAAVGAIIGVLVCVVLSRAVTSAFASMLRSRRVRDLAAIVMAVLASSVAPAQMAITAFVQHSATGQILSVARVVAWTPLAAPYAAAVDAAEGRWGTVVARLAVGVAAIAVLLWWWSRTLESAMLTVSAGGGGTARAAARTGSQVTALFPAPLRRLAPKPFGAIVARDTRYWLREPRRRASLASLVISSAVVPLVIVLSPAIGAEGSARPSGPPLPFAVMLAGVIIAVVLANQFGMDGTAYAAHLLAGVKGRTDLLARGAALAVFGVPLLTFVTIVTGALSHALGQVPAAIGVAGAAFGVSLGASSVMSVLAPYPMPDTTNPFAMNSGSGSAKGLLSALALFGSAALTVPVLIGYLVLPASLSAVILPIGLAWGLGAVLLGARIGGDLLERRGPEVLLAISPRR